MVATTAGFSAVNGPMRERVSPAEWAARVELAALYRMIHHFGMTDLIANHITMRVPGDEEHILINAYGLMYDEITASNLYKITLDGEVVLKPDVDLGLNFTGYVIHGAIHAARDDLHVVIHTHSAAGTGVSAMRCGLLPVSQHAALIDGRIGYHDYEGVAANLAERERLVANLGSGNLLILRNHGLIACGGTCAEAFIGIYRLEMACKMQVAAFAGGIENALPMPDAALENTRQVLIEHPEVSAGTLQWQALLRRMERIDPSWKD
jgi:ribulose-5-phosphate 4-epimerase/fuculose-1-phosphate aldolase